MGYCPKCDSSDYYKETSMVGKTGDCICNTCGFYGLCSSFKNHKPKNIVDNPALSKLETMGFSPQDDLVLLFGSRFCHDPEKDLINIEKHYGRSLTEAYEYLEHDILPIPTPPLFHRESYKDESEIRYEVMCRDKKNNGKVILFVITNRGYDFKRIISFRHANKRETKAYFKLFDLSGYDRVKHAWT